MKKLVLKWIGNITTLLCLTIIGIAFVSLLQSMKDPDRILTVKGYRSGLVISGSMEPAIKPGNLKVY